MPNYRRGVSAIADAQASNNQSSKSGFVPFVPQLTWKDREEKYIVFLNKAEDIPTLELHEWIPVGTRPNGKPQYESFISRKDPAIGEETDDIEDRLGQKARMRTIAVAAELEPTFQVVGNRKRPNGFRIRTDTFERNVENGREEVTYPVVGLVVQSPINFFGWVGSFNDTTANIEETPLHVIRRGDDKNTAYDFTPYIDQQIDYSPLTDYIDGISYLRDVDLGQGTPEEVGNALLEKRLEELADQDRYNELVGSVTVLESKWGKGQPQAASNPKVTNGRASGPRDSKFARLRASVEND